MATFDLIPHPDFPSPAIDSISVDVERPTPSIVWLAFRATGRLSNVLVPDEVAPGFQDGLWRNSCFEAFFGKKEVVAYTEYNLSPSGRHAAYSFNAYREGMMAHTVPKISHSLMARTEQWLEVHWSIQSKEFAERDDWRLGFSAVIEALDQTKSYWALVHSTGPPDFHNPGCFIATLPAPGAP